MGHSIITFALKEVRGGGSIEIQMYINGERVSHSRNVHIFLVEYLVHKLLTIVTRFFANFIKIPVLLKTSVLKKLHLVCA